MGVFRGEDFDLTAVVVCHQYSLEGPMIKIRPKQAQSIRVGAGEGDKALFTLEYHGLDDRVTITNHSNGAQLHLMAGDAPHLEAGIAKLNLMVKGLPR